VTVLQASALPETDTDAQTAAWHRHSTALALDSVLLGMHVGSLLHAPPSMAFKCTTACSLMHGGQGEWGGAVRVGHAPAVFSGLHSHNSDG